MELQQNDKMEKIERYFTVFTFVLLLLAILKQVCSAL